jgi:hypothetical protein
LIWANVLCICGWFLLASWNITPIFFAFSIILYITVHTTNLNRIQWFPNSRKTL